MENILKSIDNISGNITFKYKSKLGYKNWIAGIFTLIIYILTFSLSIYFLRNLFLRVDPKSYTVKKYKEEGKVTLDSNNLFHFFTIFDSKKLKMLKLDEEKEYFDAESLVLVGNGDVVASYKFDNCMKNDFSVLEELYDDNFENFYCIRKMFKYQQKNHTFDFVQFSLDSEEKEYIYNYKDYFNKNKKIYEHNEDFIYPSITIAKPEEYNKLFYYQINLSKCQNSSHRNYTCKSEEEINERLDGLFFQIKFVDNTFDVGNYSNPVGKIFNTKTVAIKPGSVSNLYLNFLSVNIMTQDGLIFDNIKKIESYAYDFHSEAFTNSENLIFHQTQFWILTNSLIYERSYPRLQNIAAEIGGIYKFFYIIGSLLNFLFDKYTNYVINNNLLDILNLTFSDENHSINLIKTKINEKINSKALSNPINIKNLCSTGYNGLNDKLENYDNQKHNKNKDYNSVLIQLKNKNKPNNYCNQRPNFYNIQQEDRAIKFLQNKEEIEKEKINKTFQNSKNIIQKQYKEQENYNSSNKKYFSYNLNPAIKYNDDNGNKFRNNLKLETENSKINYYRSNTLKNTHIIPDNNNIIKDENQNNQNSIINTCKCQIGVNQGYLNYLSEDIPNPESVMSNIIKIKSKLHNIIYKIQVLVIKSLILF